MIAIDTNVLLRYLLNDDEVQSESSRQLIKRSDTVLVTDVVLPETLWTLKGKKYKVDKAGIIQVINALFAEPNIVFEDDQVVWRSLNDYIKAQAVMVSGKKKLADFPDALIVNKARYCSKERDETLDGLYTFDVAARQLDGTRQP